MMGWEESALMMRAEMRPHPLRGPRKGTSQIPLDAVQSAGISARGPSPSRAPATISGA